MSFPRWDLAFPDQEKRFPRVHFAFPHREMAFPTARERDYGNQKVSLLVAFLLDELDVHIRITGCRLRIGGDDVYRRLTDNLYHLIDVPECFSEFLPQFLPTARKGSGADF